MADDDDYMGAPIGGGDDVALPKATVNKFANELAASLEVKLAMDTRELVAECCSEFVQLLSSEANEICEKDAKKTITPEHVLRALKQLGFERYHKEVAEELDKIKLDERGRGRDKAKKDRKNNAPDEELLALQEALFAKAREDPMNISGGPDGSGAGGDNGAGGPSQPASAAP
jgi:down-regulator of transcription 1